MYEPPSGLRYCRSKYCTGFSSMDKTSTKCCEYRPMRSLCERRESPLVGSRSPASKFMSVDLPAPLGPMMPTRVPMSMPRLRLSKPKPSRLGYLKWQSVSEMSGGGSSLGVGK